MFSIVVFLITGRLQVYGAISGGENQEDFEVLCELTALAKSKVNLVPAVDDTQDIAATIGVINISLANADFISKIDLKKDYSDSNASMKEAADGKPSKYAFLKNVLEVSHWQDKKSYAEVRRQLTTAAKRKLIHAAEVAFQIRETAKNEAQQIKAESVTAALTKVLYGETGHSKNARLPDTNRASGCGNSNKKGGSHAGNSIALNILCLCGKHSGEARGNTACGKQLTGGELDNDWTPNADPTTLFNAIIEKCNTKKPSLGLSPAAINAALSRFAARMAKSKGTNRDFHNTLGYLEGTGAGGCSGDATSTDGPCVAYQTAQLQNGLQGIPWVKELTSAGSTLQEAEKHQHTLKLLNQRIHMLNLTVTHLLEDTAPAMTTLLNSKNDGDAQSNRRNKADEECNKAGYDKTECGKQTGCTFDENKPAGQKCTLSEEGKAAEYKEEAANQEGKNEKTTNTTGRNSFVIKKNHHSACILTLGTNI
uniref:Variant surface glycoprotein 1125.4560 n=1 Tax=Trypanosoma brucei TaxID=5691 RepID=A0A1J0RAP7_9TRYP|nr:variant surface glycoprotein 1125.4560 [Trypanosoma brucei]